MPFPTGRALLDPDKILKEAGLAIGQIYADFGCGGLGHFVIPAASIVGVQGRVYALDVLKDTLVAVGERARAEKIINLQTVWGDLEHEQGTQEIPNTSVDLVSLVNITGLILLKLNVLKNIKRVLKKGGRLLLVDWRPSCRLANFLSTHRTNPNELEGLLVKEGFNLIKSFAAGQNHFGLLLEKTS